MKTTPYKSETGNASIQQWSPGQQIIAAWFALWKVVTDRRMYYRCITPYHRKNEKRSQSDN